MNQTAIRRRGFGETEEPITIIHPDSFHIQNYITTQENYELSAVYAEYTGDVILDGEPLASNLYYYKSSWGGFIIQEPGSHEFYIKNSTNSFKNVRLLTGITRPHRNANYIRNTNASYSITKLILIQNTVISTYYSMNKTRFPNLQEILVPKELEQDYKNSSNWKNVKDLIKGVEFNIIEDE